MIPCNVTRDDSIPYIQYDLFTICFWKDHVIISNVQNEHNILQARALLIQHGLDSQSARKWKTVLLKLQTRF